MERKEKIKLLANLNAALDNKELKTTIEKSPSGEMIWNLLANALNANIDSLLSDESGDSEFITKLSAAREDALNSIGQLKTDLAAITASPVMTILQRMGSTLQAANANAPQAQEQGKELAAPVLRGRNPEGRSGGIGGLI